MTSKLEKKFDITTFSKTIEEMVKFQGLNYLEALMQFAEENSLEPEAVGSLVKRSEPIRLKLEAHCLGANLLAKGAGPSLDAFFGIP